MEEHARQTDGLREALASLESRMDRRFEGMDVRLNVFEKRMDLRIEGAAAVTASVAR